MKFWHLQTGFKLVDHLHPGMLHLFKGNWDPETRRPNTSYRLSGGRSFSQTLVAHRPTGAKGEPGF